MAPQEQTPVITPFITIHYVQARTPSLTDNVADLDRLKKALLPQLNGRLPVVSWSRLVPVAAAFRAEGFKGYAVVADLPQGPEILAFLGERPPILPAIALDLGTTHLEAVLLDMMTGNTIAKTQRLNPQVDYGDDILTRIHRAEKEEGLILLHETLITGINALIQELTRQAGIDNEEIWALCVAGNTAMTHFLLGLSPHHLCREPYIPMVNTPDLVRAKDLDIAIEPMALIWVMPGVGSYFGGDLIAGIIATGLDEETEPAMLVDVGTNAEVVVGNADWLIACAGAAGPALEGGVAKMGMRAGPGAIERVFLDPENNELSYSTIGDLPPQGLCGSGIIDLVACLYLSRIIDFRGRLIPETGGGRVLHGPGGLSYMVASGTETSTNKPITITQVDIDAVMRSKAAMYAILTTVIGQVGITFPELRTIYVAGAFGRHILPRQAIILGMLPDLPLDIYVPVGNSSLAGAKKILLDHSARKRLAEVVNKITYLELNVSQEFMLRFSGARVIPHTDPSLFPSVPLFR